MQKITKAIFIGCDPGLTGAIGIIDQDSRCIAVIDVMTRRRDISKTVIKKEVSVRQTADKMTDRLVQYIEHEWHGCIEMPFSVPGGNMMGTASIFQTYGALMAMLEMIEIDVKTIKPAEWKRGFGLTKSKDLSIDIAARLWPTARIVKKKQHNQAEALLIAEYARLIWKREQQSPKETT